jgi:TonB family protein
LRGCWRARAGQFALGSGVRLRVDAASGSRLMRLLVRNAVRRDGLRALSLMLPLFALHATAMMSDEQELLVGMGVFRDHATSVVLPSYPVSSISAGHSGRAVIDVRVSGRGKVTDVRVIEAPDEDIAASVKAAIARWSFSPFQAADAHTVYAVRSRLIFYFRVIGGKPVVTDAAAEAIQRFKKPTRPS